MGIKPMTVKVSRRALNGIFIALITIPIISAVTIFTLFDYNQELREEIKLREIQMREKSKADSIYMSHTSEAAKTITTYIKGSSILINGKEYNTSQLVVKLRELYDENYKLYDSISRLSNSNSDLAQNLSYYKQKYYLYSDSTDYYKLITSVIEKYYGIKYKIVQGERNSFSVVNQGFNKSDSGLLLLPYYRKSLAYDSVKDIWIITHPK